MVVSWLTGEPTPASTVEFGTASGVYTLSANGTCASYYKVLIPTAGRVWPPCGVQASLWRAPHASTGFVAVAWS